MLYHSGFDVLILFSGLTKTTEKNVIGIFFYAYTSKSSHKKGIMVSITNNSGIEFLRRVPDTGVHNICINHIYTTIINLHSLTCRFYLNDNNL